MKKKVLKYSITILTGLLIAAWVASIKEVFLSFGYNTKTLGGLSDAFFVPGILLTCVGCLAWVSSIGFFDSVTFAVRIAVHALLPFVKMEDKTFYDYKMDREEARSGKAPIFLVVIGILFIIISVLFLLLYSSI